MTTHELSRIHGVHSELLDKLLDHGLPHRGGESGRTFDKFDVANIGLLLRLPAPSWVGMRWWSTAFKVSGDHPARVHTLRVTASAKAQSSTTGGATQLDYRVGAAAVPGSLVKNSPGVYTLQARLTQTRCDFGRTYAPLIEQILGARFHLLPPSLQRDLAFLADTGLADCKLATQFLVTKARELGVRVRPAAGLFVATPFAAWHGWVEFRVGDNWVAADPFFLNTLADWGIVDRQTWPPHRSPQPVLWRLGSSYVPLMSRNGVEVPASVAVLSSEPTG